MLSFHKYWNKNDAASIAGIMKLRETTGRPIWLGESGENSNGWFRDAIRLAESNDIGWSWWPLKKLGFNNPLEVVPNPGWQRVVDWLTGKGPRPDPADARAAMMQLASHDVDYANNVVHPDVVDAMMRQPHSDRALPFREHRLGRGPLEIAAVDYDLGPPGVAYVDRVDADYHTDTGRRADRVERRPHLSQRRRRHRPRARRDALRDGVRARRVDAIYARRRRGRPARGDADDRRRSAGDTVDQRQRRTAGDACRPARWRMADGSGAALAMLQGTNRLKLAVTAGTVRLKAIRFP